MAIAQTNWLSDHGAYLIRPALAEARLITAKHARDAVYVATLSEELRNIERTIDALEEKLDLRASAEAGKDTPALAATDLETIQRIRAKSCELEQRLRRIEELAPATRGPGSARGTTARVRLRQRLQ
jgi:hypothetical protein